jgi:hypothetical protein
VVQQHFRNLLPYLDMATLGKSEVFIHVKDGFQGSPAELGR